VEDLTRRSLIAGTCAILAAGLVNLPLAANAAVTRLANGKLSVRVKAVPELAQVGGAVRIGKLKGKNVGLARTSSATYVAFDLACPHQGVTVIREGNGWVCPSHRSEFEADGDLLLGPATSRLARIPARLSRGQVIIG
jgi:Rieske Fe-S protein